MAPRWQLHLPVHDGVQQRLVFIGNYEQRGHELHAAELAALLLKYFLRVNLCCCSGYQCDNINFIAYWLCILFPKILTPQLEGFLLIGGGLTL